MLIFEKEPFFEHVFNKGDVFPRKTARWRFKPGNPPQLMTEIEVVAASPVKPALLKIPAERRLACPSGTDQKYRVNVH